MTLLKINLQEDLISAFDEFASIIVRGVPIFVLAIILFFIGYAVAKIVSTLLGKTLKKLKVDELAVRLNLSEPLRIIGAKNGLSMFIAKIIYWLIMMAVIVSTTRRLHIDQLTNLVQDIINFMPKVIVAVLIMLVGYIIATKIKEILVNVTKSLGSSAGTVLGNILYYFIMIMVVITSIEQLGVNTDLISKNILIVVGVLLLAGAIAYGHAARGIMRNMLSSFYSRKNFREGQVIRVKELTGTILEIDKISVTLQTDSTKVVMPSSELLENNVEILEESN